MDLRHRRLVWITTILVFFLMLMVTRLGYIQLYKWEHYAREAMSREINELSLEEYSRGRILDRHGQSLTGSYRANRVAVFPKVWDNDEKTADELATVLKEDPITLKGLLNGEKPMILPFNLTGEQVKSIEDADIKGVLVVPYAYRYGPQPLAVHVVGQLGRIRDLEELSKLNQPLAKKSYLLSDWVGRQGIENFYEADLKGSYYASYVGLFTDATGKSLPGTPLLLDTNLKDTSRSDVFTTIDADIQETVERIMDSKIKKGAVVIMDKATGDLLAIASRPDFHPHPAKLGSSTDSGEESYVNQAVSLFPPGSIFKVVVASAALSEKISTKDSRYFCQGMEDKPVRCWNEAGHGWLTMEEAFAQSCNPAFVKMGQLLGPQKLIQYAKMFGLDNQEIIGYPLTPDGRQNLQSIAGDYNLVNSSVGQGPVLATPVQVTAMMNAIANGGVYVPPRLVQEVRPVQGNPRKIDPGKGEKILSPEVSVELQKMMEMVTRSGVGQKAWIEPEGTAGKTGSAQLAEGIEFVNAWFSGYGPLDNPKYTVTVLVREGVSGGETAAPIFRDIMQQLYQMPLKK